MKKEINLPGYKAIVRLYRELDGPTLRYWLEIVGICLEEYDRTDGEFAGAWVFSEAKKRGLMGFNNLRPLSSRNIISKVHSSRKGKRAYYTVPDVFGVRSAVQNLASEKQNKEITVRIPLYINLVSCGGANVSEVHTDDHLDIDINLTMPGYDYFAVRAVGDSMNAADIHNGDTLLVQAQDHADMGQRVVACTPDGITVKELSNDRGTLILIPRSTNSNHKVIPLTETVSIQGIVVTTLPAGH